MKLIATDLDRTLIPNGPEKYDGSMDLFKKIIEEKNYHFAYVTGRNIKESLQAKRKFSLPSPNFVICSVGSEIYSLDKGKPKINTNWSKEIKNKNPRWNVDKVKKFLKGIPGLRIQKKEYQGKFKASFYLYYKNDAEKMEALNKIRKILDSSIKDYNFIFSIDYPIKRGLVDIMPVGVSKIYALNFLVKENKIKAKNVLCCGDSGNDLDLLTAKYDSIVVANAKKEIKQQVAKIRKKKGLNSAYIAKKQKQLNGNYVSGIVQGIRYFQRKDKF